MNIERKRRSVAKAISWRILATITTTAIVFIFTRSFTLAFSVGIIEVFAKILIYYFHERVWTKTSWGLRRT